MSQVTQPVTVIARGTNSFPDPSLVHLQPRVEKPGGFVCCLRQGRRTESKKEMVVLLEIKNHVIKGRSFISKELDSELHWQ